MRARKVDGGPEAKRERGGGNVSDDRRKRVLALVAIMVAVMVAVMVALMCVVMVVFILSTVRMRSATTRLSRQPLVQTDIGLLSVLSVSQPLLFG